MSFPLLARQRKYSSSTLAIAAAAEIAASTAILLFWPRGWPLGALLLSFSAVRVSILAERSRDASFGIWAEIFNALRVVALVLAALGFIAIVLGLLRMAIGGHTGG